MDIKAIDNEYICNTYARFGLQVTGGKGSLVYGADGKEYIDMGSGIAVNIFGLRDKKWEDAVKKQLSCFAHTSNYYYTEPQALLAQTLCQKTGMKKVFFSNSGAEANEAAIKAARKYSFDKYGKGRDIIITLKNSFHGRTVTTLSATGQDVFHNYFFPFTPGFLFAEPNDFAHLEKLTAETSGGVCAVILELIQGEGGINPLDADYIKKTALFCAKNDILLIIDEIQTGNGRTGRLFCWQKFGIAPDIATTAKGLGGGLPIGAAMMGEKCAGTLTVSAHGSTFGGNPVCAAGALNIISRIDETLLAGVLKKEKYIKKRLKGCKGVLGATGAGLMIGIKTEKDAKELTNKLLEKGVLALTAKDKLRLLPALNIPDRLLKQAMDIITQTISE